MAVHRPPKFYSVPAGTEAAHCRSGRCNAVIYFVESSKTPGKMVPIDCAVVGGITPTPLTAGSGILHPIVCRDREKFERPPARPRKHRLQRGLEVDIKPPACIVCLETGLELSNPQPPICTKASCIEQFKGMPLRMRIPHARPTR